MFKRKFAATGLADPFRVTGPDSVGKHATRKKSLKFRLVIKSVWIEGIITRDGALGDKVSRSAAFPIGLLFRAAFVWYSFYGLGIHLTGLFV